MGLRERARELEVDQSTDGVGVVAVLQVMQRSRKLAKGGRLAVKGEGRSIVQGRGKERRMAKGG